jgi:hypothetical protein
MLPIFDQALNCCRIDERQSLASVRLGQPDANWTQLRTDFSLYLWSSQLPFKSCGDFEDIAPNAKID